MKKVAKRANWEPRGLHPPDDEPHRRGVLEGEVVSATSAAPPVGNRRPGIFRYGPDIVQAFVLAEGDGEAIHLAADGYHAMSVEAARPAP